MVKKGVKQVVIHDSSSMTHFKDRGKEQLIAQGAVSESSTALGYSFIVPFAEKIGANALHIGFLSAFAGLLAPIGSLLGSKLMESRSRKKISITYTLWQALIWFPVIGIIFMLWKGFALPYLPIILIAFYSLFVFFTGVKDPPSFSWLGDLVSEKERGHYFARRNRIIGWYSLVVFLVAGFVLRFFETRGFLLTSFILMFLLAIFLRFISLYQTKKVFCPSFKLKKGYYFSFWSFIKRYDNFGKFAVFQAVFNFSIMVASPFFAVYMLNDLKFNILTFTIVSLSSTVFYLLFMPLAGKFSDKYGNLKLLYIAGLAFPLNAFLWVFIKDPVGLTLLPGLVSGIGNAALTIGITNYTYDSVSPERRGICVAYTGILNGVGVFLGSIAGGLMIQYLDISFMNKTLFVFALAAGLRLLTALIFLPQIKEVRRVNKVKGLSADILHPFKSVHSDVVWFKKFIYSK